MTAKYIHGKKSSERKKKHLSLQIKDKDKPGLEKLPRATDQEDNNQKRTSCRQGTRTLWTREKRSGKD